MHQWTLFVTAKARRHFYHSTGRPERRGHNLIVRIGKFEAEVTNNKKYGAWGIVLLNLTTDGHEASRGLSGTAELLVKIHSLLESAINLQQGVSTHLKHVAAIHYTRSSAVAKRPRAASCLSIVSFNSTKRRVQSFIVSYIGYRFNTACR